MVPAFGSMTMSGGKSTQLGYSWPAVILQGSGGNIIQNFLSIFFAITDSVYNMQRAHAFADQWATHSFPVKACSLSIRGLPTRKAHKNSNIFDQFDFPNFTNR